MWAEWGGSEAALNNSVAMRRVFVIVWFDFAGGAWRDLVANARAFGR
jgi:hypothetical protein